MRAVSAASPISAETLTSSEVQRLEPLGEAPGMRFLGLGQGLEPLRDLLEALGAGRLGEARVHLRELVGLALDRRLEVLVGVADRDARTRVARLLQEVQVAERMARLRLGRVPEEAADVRVALDVGAPGKIEVATVRLRLAGERVLQVVVRLRAFDRLRHLASLATEDGDRC